jgi:hypothetical protein
MNYSQKYFQDLDDLADYDSYAGIGGEMGRWMELIEYICL